MEALPRIDTAATTQLPVYKYLRGSDNLNDHGELRDASAIPKKVLTRVQNRDKPLTGLKQYANSATKSIDNDTTFTDLMASEDVDGVRGDVFPKGSRAVEVRVQRGGEGAGDGVLAEAVAGARGEQVHVGRVMGGSRLTAPSWS